MMARAVPVPQPVTVKYQWDTQNSMLFHVCKSFFLFLHALLFSVLSLETFKVQFFFYTVGGGMNFC